MSLREQDVRALVWLVSLLVGVPVWAVGLHGLERGLGLAADTAGGTAPDWLRGLLQFLWLGICLLVPAYALRGRLRRVYPGSPPRSADWRSVNATTGATSVHRP